MLRKTAKSGEDQYLALLNIRNAPTQGVDSSLAQRLMGRRTRTLLPTTRSLLEPRNPLNPHEMEHLQLNQKRQAKYYNRTAHDLPTLKEGNTVRMKPFVLGQHTWKKVTRRLDERSYEVQASGTTYRRNQQHLVKTSQPSEQQALAKEPHPVPSTDCKMTTPGQDTQHIASPQNQAEGKSDTATLPNPCDSRVVKRSRSGRAIKPTARLKDYVLTWTLFSFLRETNQYGTKRLWHFVFIYFLYCIYLVVFFSFVVVIILFGQVAAYWLVCFFLFPMVNLLVHIVALILLKKKKKKKGRMLQCVLRDTYVITSLWGIKLFFSIRHFEHACTLWSSSLALFLSTISLQYCYSPMIKKFNLHFVYVSSFWLQYGEPIVSLSSQHLYV